MQEMYKKRESSLTANNSASVLLQMFASKHKCRFYMVNSLQMSKHALVCFQWHSTFYSYLHTSISTLSNKENIYVHLFFTNDSVTEVFQSVAGCCHLWPPAGPDTISRYEGLKWCFANIKCASKDFYIEERRKQSEAVLSERGKKELQPKAKKTQTWGGYSNVSIHFSIIYMLKTADLLFQSIPTHHPETFKEIHFQWLSC